LRSGAPPCYFAVTQLFLLVGKGGGHGF
jgi:hypothetical protein